MTKKIIPIVSGMAALAGLVAAALCLARKHS